MHTVREAFFKIRGIASAWIGNQQGQDASEAMGQVTATLLDTDTRDDVVTISVDGGSVAEQIAATLGQCEEHAAAAVDASIIATPPAKFSGPPIQLVDHSDGPVEHVWFSQAALDVGAERRRQIEVEGWVAGQDDKYTSGQLAAAAGSYALHAHEKLQDLEGAPAWWPWDESWFKLTDDPRRNLVKAGALILAEIERLDRVEAAKPADQDLVESAMMQAGIDPAPSDDAQACADAFNNEYHKCPAEISRPEWDQLWAKGMTPPQLRAAGWTAWNANACQERPKAVSAVLFRNGDETTKVEGVNWAPQSDSFRHHEVVAYRVAPVEDGWIPHHAEGPCPFDRPDLAMVDIRFRDGSEKVGGLACNYIWFWRSHDRQEDDVVAFRMHRPEPTDDELF